VNIPKCARAVGMTVVLLTGLVRPAAAQSCDAQCSGNSLARWTYGPSPDDSVGGPASGGDGAFLLPILGFGFVLWTFEC
jgi:hypothetical protein